MEQDQEAYEALESYHAKGFLQKFETLSEVEVELGCKPALCKLDCIKRWSSMQTLGNTPIRPESYWIARGQGVSNMAKHTQPKDLQPSMKFVAVCQTRDPKRIHSEVWSMTFTLLPAMLQGRRNWGLGEVPYRVLRSMRVSSLCKLGGYRSLKKHLSCAKDHHVTLVYAGRNSRKCSRSVLRGLAGSTRSMDFDVVRSALHLTKAHLELDDQGPAHPRAMLITATIFPLRAGSFRIGLGGHFIWRG